MNPYNTIVHQFDTQKSSALTIFDGSQEDERKLAKQFWNSMVLVPPVESTLVCKEIHQRIRSRTLNNETSRPRFSTTKSKTKEEKSIRDKIYDEKTELQKAEDETKQIQAIGKRHEQVRQLFRKQTKANRTKNEQWNLPQSINYSIHPIHQQSTIHFQEELDQKLKKNKSIDN